MSKSQTVVQGLETTLRSLDLRHEAAAHVAAMRKVAAQMDRCQDADTLSKVAAVFLRQLTELRQWVAPPPIEADPFDELARALSKGSG